MNAKDYTPISCDFHSLFEHYATLKEVVKLVLTDSKEEKGVITDVYTKKGEEFIVLDQSEHIRLDRVKSINGSQSIGSC